MLTTWPLTVTVPVRELFVLFLDVLNATSPIPDPDEPEVIASHGALLCAVQEQPVVLDTAMEPFWGLSSSVKRWVDTVTVQIWPLSVTAID